LLTAIHSLYIMIPSPPISTLFPYTTLFRSRDSHLTKDENLLSVEGAKAVTEIVSPLSGTVKDVHKEVEDDTELLNSTDRAENWIDRKSTRLNSSHVSISYAVFCLKKKK